MSGVFSPIAPRKPGLLPLLPLPLPRRFVIVALLFLCTFVCYMDRTGFSIFFTDVAERGGILQSVKGGVLSSFYYGYALTQIPGGALAARYGGRRVLVPSFLLWTSAALVMPTSAGAVLAIVAARVLTGGAQGVIFPSIHTVLAQWIPPHERSRAVSLTTSGMYLGSALSMLWLPGVVASAGAAALPRLVGLLGLGWLAVWVANSSEAPGAEALLPLPNTSVLPTATFKGGKGDDDEAGEERRRPVSIPWTKMMVSAPVWAIIVNNFVFHYAFYVLMNWMPTYFERGLGTKLSAMGVFKMLPYFMMFVFSNVGGVAADYMIGTLHLRVGYTRKVLNSAGFLVAAAALFLLPFSASIGSAVLYTTIALGACALSRSGFAINHMDIAPRQAGVLMALSNTAGTLAGVIGVALTGFLLDATRDDNGNSNWFAVFAMPSALCVVSAAVFVAFAKGERVFE